jgi:hypothetical protein
MFTEDYAFKRGDEWAYQSAGRTRERPAAPDEGDLSRWEDDGGAPAEGKRPDQGKGRKGKGGGERRDEGK